MLTEQCLIWQKIKSVLSLISWGSVAPLTMGDKISELVKWSSNGLHWVLSNQHNYRKRLIHLSLQNKRLYNKVYICRSLSYTHTHTHTHTHTNIFTPSQDVAREFSSTKVWGVKLLCSLLVQQQILLYLLSDGSRVNRLWLDGCCHLVSLRFVQTSHFTDITDAW